MLTLSTMPDASHRASPDIVNRTSESRMNLGTILLVVVILLLVGAFPAWPHSRSWGYMPSGGLGVVLVVLLVLLVMGRL